MLKLISVDAVLSPSSDYEECVINIEHISQLRPERSNNFSGSKTIIELSNSSLIHARESMTEILKVINKYNEK